MHEKKEMKEVQTNTQKKPLPSTHISQWESILEKWWSFYNAKPLPYQNLFFLSP